MKINNIFNKKKHLIIAEVSQSHDGSINFAHSFIDAAANAGANVIKFQSHFADEESTLDEKFRKKISFKKENRFEYWKRMEFSSEEWLNLYKHAKKKNLLFCCSVFSEYAAELINKIGIDIWKIASGESMDLNLIKHICKISSKPILVSTGMSFDQEIDKIYNFLKKKNNKFVLMHCTSEYPNKIENLGLNIIDDFKKKYKCDIGYSDHSGNINTSLLAFAKDVKLVEVHVTFDKEMYGPDVSSSLTFQELKFLSEFVKFKYISDRNKIKKDSITKKLSKMRSLFSKSLALKKDKKKNTLISNSNLTLKKPGNGIQEKDKYKIIGKILKRDLNKNRLIKWSDIKK